MEQFDFLRFGYAGGCSGCVHLQAALAGSRNHQEVRRSRIEACLDNTLECRARKDRAAQRREDQLTRELERQDELITNIDDVDAAAAAAIPDVSEGENPTKQPKSPERFVMSPLESLLRYADVILLRRQMPGLSDPEFQSRRHLLCCPTGTTLIGTCCPMLKVSQTTRSLHRAFVLLPPPGIGKLTVLANICADEFESVQNSLCRNISIPLSCIQTASVSNRIRALLAVGFTVN